MDDDSNTRNGEQEMTNEEAIEKLKTIEVIFDYTLAPKDSTDAIEIAIQALEKEIPMKPLKLTMSIF